MNDTVSSLAHTLQTYGGWGVAALCILGLLLMWREYSKQRDKLETVLQAQTQSAITLIAEQVETAVESRVALEKIALAMQAIERRLENVEKTRT